MSYYSRTETYIVTKLLLNLVDSVGHVLDAVEDGDHAEDGHSDSDTSDNVVAALLKIGGVGGTFICGSINNKTIDKIHSNDMERCTRTGLGVAVPLGAVLSNLVLVLENLLAARHGSSLHSSKLSHNANRVHFIQSKISVGTTILRNFLAAQARPRSAVLEALSNQILYVQSLALLINALDEPIKYHGNVRI